MQQRTALLAGATGLIGSFCLRYLLDSEKYSTVKVISRRKLKTKHPKLKSFVFDFDEMEKHPDAFHADDIYCCLGTTIRKAGSKEDFYKVDYTYTINMARLACKKDAKQFLLVSSLGANTESWFFYNRVKGEVENAVQKLEYPSVSIVRPSLLLGDRDEVRMGEDFFKVLLRILFFIWIGPLRKYKPIHANAVARAMLTIARQKKSGSHVYESKELEKLGVEEV